MYPFETACGMDIVKVRKEFPTLRIQGSIPKSDISRPDLVDRFLGPVEAVLETGGYIPYGDHFIPPDVTWEGFKYYRHRLNDLIDKCGSI